MHSLLSHALLDEGMSASSRVWFTIFDAVFRALPAGVALLDAGGRVVALNAEWETIVGTGYSDHILTNPQHSYAEMAGHLDLWGGEHADKVGHAIREIVAGRSHDFCEELPVQVGDKAGWHRVSLVPLDRSAFDGVVAMHVDVTQERQLREEMQRFIHIASHDLQEPLRTIASYLQLLERRYKGQLDEDAHTFITYAVDGAKRLSTLIRDLLTYSRLTGHAQIEACDLNASLSEVLHALEASIKEAGADISVTPLPSVMFDPVQMGSLFQNLIGNAIKYRHPDRPLRISVSAERRGALWEFIVADNGIGIDPDYQHKIFEMFQRLNPRDGLGGTGIGLAIAKRIVEQAGGRIHVLSEPEGGSSFHFTLPAMLEAPTG
jgi:light-regulated signal transduction histidine kinase (bacteriophytochrome)